MEKRKKKDQGVIIVNFADAAFAVLKNKVLIAALIAAGLFIGTLKSSVSALRQTETITASVLVTAKWADGKYASDDAADSPSLDSYNLEVQMADSALALVTSDAVVNKVTDRLGLSETTGASIKRNMSVVREKGTVQILNLSLSWNNGQEGLRIMETVVDSLDDAMQETMDLGGISVTNEPAIKGELVGMSMKTILLFGAIGAFIGIALSVRRLARNPSLSNPGNVERLIQEELLGEIPRERLKEGYWDRALAGDERASSAEYWQSHAFVAALVARRMEESGKRVALVTSSQDAEGKTTLAANVALQWALAGKRTLLVDMDARRPELAGVLGAAADPERAVARLADADDPGSSPIEIAENLFLLPGLLDGKPARFGGRDCWAVKDLAEKFDVAIVDGPPAGSASDVAGLVGLDAGVVFAARQDRVSVQTARANVDNLERLGFDVLGVVMTDVRMQKLFHDRQYGYGVTVREGVVTRARSKARGKAKRK